MCDQVQIHQAFLDRCITLLVEHKLTTETASMIKYSATDMCGGG
jgi:acyl-CoA dehydrogenase